MGNEINVSKAEKVEKKEFLKFDSSKLYSTDIDSDYKGVKTCIGDNEMNIITHHNEDITIERTNNNKNNNEKNKHKIKEKLETTTESSTGYICNPCIKEIKIPTKFEWKDGGNVVYLVGSFSNWTQWFTMKNTGKDYFELILVNNIRIIFYFSNFQKIFIQ